MDETELRRLGRRLTVSYSLIQSYFNMSYCCIVGFATVFLLSRGFTSVQVGITLAIANSLAIVFQPVVAAFADKTKKIPLKYIVTTMLIFITVLSCLLLILPAIVLPTAILYVLLLGFQSLPSPLLVAMSMEHINRGVPLNFSLARGIGSFAYAILSVLMGFLVHDVGGPIIIQVSIGLSIAGILLVSRFQSAEPAHVHNHDFPGDTASGFLTFANQNKRFVVVSLSIALIFFSHVLLDTYEIQIIRHVGGNTTDVGIAYAIAGFLELPAMALFPQILKRLKHASTVMKIAGFFFVIRTLITLLAHSVAWIYVAQCSQFFAFAMLIPASVYYVNRIIRNTDKVKGQALIGMARGVSGVLGTVLGGLMLETRGGVLFMLTVGLIVSVAGLVLLMLIAPRDMESTGVPTVDVGDNPV